MKKFKRIELGVYYDQLETILYRGTCKKDINGDTIVAVKPKLRNSEWVARQGKEDIFNTWQLARDLSVLVPVRSMFGGKGRNE